MIRTFARPLLAALVFGEGDPANRSREARG